MVGFKNTTYTTLVSDALTRADDFRNLDQLILETKCTRPQMMESLRYLKTRKAVDCIDSEGHLWWFLTPETDTRCKKVEERSPERKRRTRRLGPRKKRAIQIRW